MYRSIWFFAFVTMLLAVAVDVVSMTSASNHLSTLSQHPEFTWRPGVDGQHYQVLGAATLSTAGNLRAIGAALRRYREGRGILAFVAEQFGVQPDPWQENALLKFASPAPEHRRISLQACVGPGKSAVLAWGGWWFLGCQGERGEHPKGACVSITRENLRDNLMSEYAKWQARSPYLSSTFTCTGSRIFANDHAETWFLSARTWSKSANADEQGKTLSGLHSKYVLAQVDESGAVPLTVLRAAEQALAQASGGFGKIIQAGNPISLEGMLHAAANQLRHQWYVIRITGDPDDKNAWIYSPRVGTQPREHAKEQLATYGRENPWVKSYLLGQFPPASINALLGIEEVQRAMARHYKPDAFEFSQKRIGIDVARFGDDRSVLFPRQGLVAFAPVVLRNMRTTDIAARAAQGINRWGAELTLVDDTGHWGHGVIDNLITAGFDAVPVIFSDRAINPRFKNRRCEMWMSMAEWVKAGGALPNIPELVGELTQPTYSFVGGQFMLEEKDQIKKRLGRSPDLADALALTFEMPDQPATLARGLQRHQSIAATDYNPFVDDQEAERARARHAVEIAERDYDPYAALRDGDPWK